MSQRVSRYYCQRGLTLVELMVALAVLWILITLALPSFQQQILKQQLKSQSNRLFLALTFSRSEAIKWGQTVTICAVQQNEQCAVQQSDWQLGWLIFIDTNNNKRYEANEPLLQQTDALPSNLSLRWNRTSNIRFNSRGQSPGHNGSFTLCAGLAAEKQLGRKIILANTGRVRIDSQAATLC